MAARIRIVTNVGWLQDPLTRFVVLSLAAHAVAIVVLVVVPTLRGSNRITERPLVVDLVAAAPPGPPAGSANVAPPPPPAPETQPAEPAEGVRVETREPPPAKPLPEDPQPRKKPPEKKPEPRKEPPPPRRPRSTAPPTDGPPPENPAPGEATAGPSGPPGEAGATITAMQGGDSALGWYQSSVTGALYTHWRKPIVEGVGEPYEVLVIFEILRDGSIRNLKIERSSGVPSLDRSALRAVSDASPLPPLPRSWREPVLSAGFVFRLFPE